MFPVYNLLTRAKEPGIAAFDKLDSSLFTLFYMTESVGTFTNLDFTVKF